jgi:hypothetical protein
MQIATMGTAILVRVNTAAMDHLTSALRGENHATRAARGVARGQIPRCAPAISAGSGAPVSAAVRMRGNGTYRPLSSRYDRTFGVSGRGSYPGQLMYPTALDHQASGRAPMAR